MAPTKDQARKFGEILEFLKIDFFYPKMHIFLLFSFIECTTVWDVNSQLPIKFDDLQVEIRGAIETFAEFITEI